MVTTQSDVKTISYKGKPYVEVAERVRQVHANNLSFEVISSEPLEVIGRVIFRVTILVDGKKYTGSAEAKIQNAVPKSADATNPFECAETSALGRALAFAGLGTVDGIASYDEIARGQDRDELRRDTTNAPTSGAAANNARQPSGSAAPAALPATTSAAPDGAASNQRATSAPVALNDIPTYGDLCQTVKENKILAEDGSIMTMKDIIGVVFAGEINAGKTTADRLMAAGNELAPKYCLRVANYIKSLTGKKAS